MLKNDVIQKLEMFGCVVDTYAEKLVDLCIEKAENYILSATNQTEIPQGLHQVTVDMVVGEYLFILKATGKLPDNFNLEMVVKQISEGDTTVTFAVDGSKTPEQRLDALINHLLKPSSRVLAQYRRLKW